MNHIHPKTNMSYKTMLLLMVSAFILSCSTGRVEIDFTKETFWEYEELYGDIKEIREQRLVDEILDSSASTITTYSISDRAEIITQYNRDDKVIKNEVLKFFRNSASLNKYPTERRISGLHKLPESIHYRSYRFVEHYKYDSFGNIVFLKYIGSCDTVVEKSSFEYDGKMNITKILTNRTTTFCKERIDAGAINHQTAISTTTFDYDKNGVLLEKRIKIDNSPYDLYSISHFEYDSDNNLRKVIVYEEVGNDLLISNIIEFSARMDVVSIHEYRNGILVYIVENKYRFDKYGNWTEKEMKMLKEDEKIGKITIQREIEYN